MIRELTDAEAAVILAAVDAYDLGTEYAHGGRQSSYNRLMDARLLLDIAIINLHNENDGRWNAP